MEIVHQHPQDIFYFPDMTNTAGLFMRFGAGCTSSTSLFLFPSSISLGFSSLHGKSSAHGDRIGSSFSSASNRRRFAQTSVLRLFA